MPVLVSSSPLDIKKSNILGSLILDINTEPNTTRKIESVITKAVRLVYIKYTIPAPISVVKHKNMAPLLALNIKKYRPIIKTTNAKIFFFLG
jgi:hypothetical protein